MSKYPGPEYLVSGEPDECKHGVPSQHDCCDCLLAKLDALEHEHERLAGKLDWRKFANEAPTEPSSVVCCTLSDGHWDMFLWCFVSRNGGYWDSIAGAIDRNHPGVVDRWNEEARDSEWTHWAYVDPPEGT